MKSLSCLSDRDAGFTDLVGCLFSLNDLELEILDTLDKGSTLSLDDLSEAVKRNRTTAFRSLDKLISIGFVQKIMVPLPSGGRVASFRRSGNQEIRRLIYERKVSICENFDRIIESLGNE
jgi:predicted transcriptional regulator